MRFRLKSILIATTAACVLVALAAPYIRQLDATKQQRLLVACGVAALCVLGSTIITAMSQRRATRGLGDGPIVGVAETKRLLNIAMASGQVLFVLLALFSIANYVGIGFRSYDRPLYFDLVFLSLVALCSAQLSPLSGLASGTRRIVYKFGEQGMSVANRFLPWNVFEAIDYDQASQLMKCKIRLQAPWKITCPPEKAQRIQELYEQSKQPQDNTTDGDAA